MHMTITDTEILRKAAQQWILVEEEHETEQHQTSETEDCEQCLNTYAIRLYRLAYEKGKKNGIEEGCTCEVDNEPPDKEGYND
jgi:hypothetical protein